MDWSRYGGGTRDLPGCSRASGSSGPPLALALPRNASWEPSAAFVVDCCPMPPRLACASWNCGVGPPNSGCPENIAWRWRSIPAAWGIITVTVLTMLSTTKWTVQPNRSRTDGTQPQTNKQTKAQTHTNKLTITGVITWKRIKSNSTNRNVVVPKVVEALPGKPMHCATMRLGFTCGLASYKRTAYYWYCYEADFSCTPPAYTGASYRILLDVVLVWCSTSVRRHQQMVRTLMLSQAAEDAEWSERKSVPRRWFLNATRSDEQLRSSSWNDVSGDRGEEPLLKLLCHSRLLSRNDRCSHVTMPSCLLPLESERFCECDCCWIIRKNIIQSIVLNSAMFAWRRLASSVDSAAPDHHTALRQTQIPRTRHHWPFVQMFDLYAFVWGRNAMLYNKKMDAPL